MLNYVLQGDGPATPLIIAHGLYGSARNWNVLAKRLSTICPVVAVDMRNHGASPWFGSHSYNDMAADLAEVIDAFGGRAHVLGHSMGGKAAMVLALSRPEIVASLIAADIAPVAYGHTQVHLITAMRQVDLSKVDSRRNADQQLAAFVAEDSVRAFLLQSLDLKGETPRWRLNFETLEAAMGPTVGFPSLNGAYLGRTLFLSGGASDYVKPEHHNEVKRLFPNVEFEVLAGAGHWLHAEKPREFEAAVAKFINPVAAASGA